MEENLFCVRKRKWKAES